MTAVAGCAFVTKSLSVLGVLDIFGNLPDVCINRAPINAKGGEVYVLKPDTPEQAGLQNKYFLNVAS